MKALLHTRISCAGNNISHRCFTGIITKHPHGIVNYTALSETHLSCSQLYGVLPLQNGAVTVSTECTFYMNLQLLIDLSVSLLS
jgi:hypothetical protein